MGNPARVVASVFPTEAALVSPALLDEYRLVLRRPAAVRFHGRTDEAIDRLLGTVEELSQLVAPAAGPACPDPTDQHLWDLLAGVPEAVLVTGERLLLSSGHFPGRILSPREFVERYLGEPGQP
jgi:predicted nucleic acid-binding protein